jgi:putative hydrolase of HD superfamily
MESTNTRTPEVLRAVDALKTLGRIAVGFAQVERAPRLPSGERENDVEHSYHLSLSAVELADRFYPDLDKGLIAQFAIIHDLPEYYTGDVRTFRITPEERAAKESAEAEATEKLLKELPPYWADLLRRYELQEEPEARFVRFVDKLMPGIINMQTDLETSTFLTDYDVTSVDELREQRAQSAARLQEQFPEFPVVHIIKEILSEQTAEHFFPSED